MNYKDIKLDNIKQKNIKIKDIELNVNANEILKNTKTVLPDFKIKTPKISKSIQRNKEEERRMQEENIQTNKAILLKLSEINEKLKYKLDDIEDTLINLKDTIDSSTVSINNNQIQNNNLLKEFKKLIEDNTPTGRDKLVKFIGGLEGNLAVGLLLEYFKIKYFGA